MEAEKGPGFSRFVHALNCGGTPSLPHTIDTRPTVCDVMTILQYFSHTSSDAEDLDRCLSYALQRLDSPEMRPKPEQQSAIESAHRGKDVFGWYLRGIIDSSLYASSRYTILSLILCCIPVVLNNATLFLLLTSVRRQAFIADMVILTSTHSA